MRRTVPLIARPVPLSRRRYLLVLVVPVVVLLLFWNFAGLAHTLSLLPHAGRVSDPAMWRQVNLDDPYAWTYVRWTPPMVVVWTYAMTYALPIVMGLSVAALFLLPLPVALIGLVSWPFWEGTLGGGIMPFVVVSGWYALNGNRWGMTGYVLLFALVPRPLMLPVLAVVLWRNVEARWTLLGALGFVVLVSLAMGQLDDWLGSLALGITEGTVNLSPSVFLGPWWLLVGVPLGVFLTWKGWYGLASLAVSPYVLLSYLLVLLWELRRTESSPTRSRTRTPAAAPSRSAD